MSDKDKKTGSPCSLDGMVRWTHYHCPSWGERCIVLQTRGGLLGFIIGTQLVLLEDGHVGWCHKDDIVEIPHKKNMLRTEPWH